jgi:CheY-like chemotaxis protein
VDSQNLNNLTIKKNNPKKRHQSNKRIIICHVLNIYIGLLVDSTKKIMIQPNENMLPPPSIWDHNQQLFVSALIHEKEHYRYLFDLEKYMHFKGIHFQEVSQTIESTYAHLKNKTCLVVEDSALYQFMLKKSLGKYDVHVEIAKDGKQGLKMLLENEGKYDFILCDIEMPFMNGIDMVREYKRILKKDNTKVIFHSAISNANLVHDIEQEKLGQYLIKFNEEELLKAVEIVLQG